ncbi:fimbrial protein [Salmonella enterica]|nr:fimbrial protein [Salmonella enterica]EBP8096293.1 fimbrial protein [Salmonella enterica]
MKIKVLMIASLIIFQPVLASDVTETIQYLGVANGQVVGNSLVRVTRTPTDPTLFRTKSSDLLPHELVIRNAESRQAARGLANIKIKHLSSDGRNMYLNMKTVLIVDGMKVAINANQKGDDVIIIVPTAFQQVELKSESVIELEVPADYRGNILIPVEVKGVNIN